MTRFHIFSQSIQWELIKYCRMPLVPLLWQKWSIWQLVSSLQSCGIIMVIVMCYFIKVVHRGPQQMNQGGPPWLAIIIDQFSLLSMGRNDMKQNSQLVLSKTMIFYFFFFFIFQVSMIFPEARNPVTFCTNWCHSKRRMADASHIFTSLYLSRSSSGISPSGLSAIKLCSSEINWNLNKKSPFLQNSPILKKNLH